MSSGKSLPHRLSMAPGKLLRLPLCFTFVTGSDLFVGLVSYGSLPCCRCGRSCLTLRWKVTFRPRRSDVQQRRSHFLFCKTMHDDATFGRQIFRSAFAFLLCW